jgi:hypothetical protein
MRFAISYHLHIKLQPTMSNSIRQATTADAARIVHFNTLMAGESEHPALDKTRLEAGVRALLLETPNGDCRIEEGLDSEESIDRGQ